MTSYKIALHLEHMQMTISDMVMPTEFGTAGLDWTTTADGYNVTIVLLDADEEEYVIIESPRGVLIGMIVIGFALAAVAIMLVTDLPKIYRDLSGKTQQDLRIENRKMRARDKKERAARMAAKQEAKKTKSANNVDDVGVLSGSCVTEIEVFSRLSDSDEYDHSRDNIKTPLCGNRRRQSQVHIRTESNLRIPPSQTGASGDRNSFGPLSKHDDAPEADKREQRLVYNEITNQMIDRANELIELL